MGLSSVLLTFWEPEGDVTAEPRLCSGWQSTLQACFLKGISTAFHSAFSSDFLSQLSIYCTQGSSFHLPLKGIFPSEFKMGRWALGCSLQKHPFSLLFAVYYCFSALAQWVGFAFSVVSLALFA